MAINRDHIRRYVIFITICTQTGKFKKNAVFRTVERYRMPGSVKNRPRSGRPRTATADDKKLDVLLSIQENPRQSTNKLGGS